MNYCVNGKTIYGKFYKYDSLGVTYTENFDPIVEVIKKEDNRIIFMASLPIPDSLINKPSSTLKYDLKPLLLRDSFLFETKYEAEIIHSESYYGELEVKKEDQIFYGYILGMDTITNQPLVYNAFEIPIIRDSISIQ